MELKTIEWHTKNILESKKCKYTKKIEGWTKKDFTTFMNWLCDEMNSNKNYEFTMNYIGWNGKNVPMGAKVGKDANAHCQTFYDNSKNVVLKDMLRKGWNNQQILSVLTHEIAHAILHGRRSMRAKTQYGKGVKEYEVEYCAYLVSGIESQSGYIRSFCNYAKYNNEHLDQAKSDNNIKYATREIRAMYNKYFKQLKG